LPLRVATEDDDDAAGSSTATDFSDGFDRAGGRETDDLADFADFADID